MTDADGDLGNTLLIVDDDTAWLNRLERAMERRGYDVHTSETVSGGINLAQKLKPDYAVVDMRLLDGNGMDVIEAIQTVRPDGRVIMLTGYGNIATAVEAVKKGAIDYLAKPADADEIEAALKADPETKAPPPKTRCQQTVCGGSIFNAFMNCVTATCQKRHGGSTCTVAPCSAFWPNAPRVKFR